jgi:hypothetical protein
VPLVFLRSPTQATLLFATTAVLVAVTLVARNLALHARVPPSVRFIKPRRQPSSHFLCYCYSYQHLLT